MATPQRIINDPTAGLELIDRQGEGIEATQYVFLALDVLDPERREVEHLRRGGEEVSSHCLRRTPNFVPRYFITPVEIWVEHMALERVPDGVRSVEVKDNTLALVGGDSRSVIQNILRGKPLRSIRTYPGEEISDIIGTYQKVGIVKLDSLGGTEWDAGEAQRLQDEFFPTSWALPTALRLGEEQIRDRYNVHPLIAEDMLRSCAASRRWAQARLQAEHVLLDTRTRHEWTYTYSPIARSLLSQLEMTPRDQGWETMMAQSNSKMTEVMAQAMTQSIGGGLDVNALAQAIATAIVTAQNAGKSNEQIQDEAPAIAQEYFCKGCGDPFTSPQGKSMHERLHCAVLKAQNEETTESTE